MSNPLPKSEVHPRRGCAPSPIDCNEYPALAEFSTHVSRDGAMLIDRVYREALALFHRALEAEQELELYRPTPPERVHNCSLNRRQPAGEELL